MRALLLVAAGLLGADLYVSLARRRRARRDLFAAAQERARQAGVPLLVVGDPDTGYVTRFLGRDYDCGNLCTDLTGCPGCPNGIGGSLEEVLARLPSRSHVVYVSATLEYVRDLPAAIQQIERVAIPDGIFVVRVEYPHSTWLVYAGAHWIVESAPPSGPWRYRPYVFWPWLLAGAVATGGYFALTSGSQR